jgi:hypothetical protein
VPVFSTPDHGQSPRGFAGRLEPSSAGQTILDTTPISDAHGSHTQCNCPSTERAVYRPFGPAIYHSTLALRVETSGSDPCQTILSLKVLWLLFFDQMPERSEICRRLTARHAPGPLAPDRGRKTAFEDRVEIGIGRFQHNAQHGVDLVGGQA